MEVVQLSTWQVSLSFASITNPIGMMTDDRRHMTHDHAIEYLLRRMSHGKTTNFLHHYFICSHHFQPNASVRHFAIHIANERMGHITTTTPTRDQIKYVQWEPILLAKNCFQCISRFLLSCGRRGEPKNDKYPSTAEIETNRMESVLGSTPSWQSFILTSII